MSDPEDHPDPIPVRTYERVFVLAIPTERAWQLFTDPQETSAWLVPTTETEDGRTEMNIPGQPPTEVAVKEFDPPTRLRTTMTGGAIPGLLEITVVFESVETGTKITITRCGFGDAEAWEGFGQSNTLGWDEAIADLKLYVRTGVRAPRHAPDLRSSIAAWPVYSDGAIELAEVKPGGFADQAGLVAGDVLLKLDQAAIYQISDI